MSSTPSVALLGGPESGKSTYLAALVDALHAGRCRQLEMSGWPDDALPLKRIVEPLRRGHYPERTKLADGAVPQLPVRVNGTGASSPGIRLRFGDYAGEQVERLFQNRTTGWSSEWQERANGNGLLLFFRGSATAAAPRAGAPHVARSVEWQSLRRANSDDTMRSRALRRTNIAPRTPSDLYGATSDDDLSDTRPAAPTDPVRIPSVLSMIEVFQFLRYVRGLAPGERVERGTFKVAVMVSAWDIVPAAWRARGAAAYCSEFAPLLRDFLWSNWYPEDVIHFGLSSTGGDLWSEPVRQRYLEDPGGFVEWSTPSGIVRSSDISIPVAWTIRGAAGDAALMSD